MSSPVYTINKGINQPVQFKGFQAQYIGYMGLALVALLLLFAILYISGLNPFISLFIIGSVGVSLFVYIGKLSYRHGPHGLRKKWARKEVPHLLRAVNRTIFIKK